jgi:hypothetical protein
LGSKKTSNTRVARLDDNVSIDIYSGDESDGRNTLRGVEAREEPAVVCQMLYFDSFTPMFV